MPRQYDEISSELKAALYRTSLTDDRCFMTGSKAMGVSNEASDVDFFLTHDLCTELNIDLNSGSWEGYNDPPPAWNTKSIKLQDEDGVVYNIIIPSHVDDREDVFGQWKYATDMCTKVAQIDPDSMRVKQLRVSTFEHFSFLKRQAIRRTPEWIEAERIRREEMIESMRTRRSAQIHSTRPRPFTIDSFGNLNDFGSTSTNYDGAIPPGTDRVHIRSNPVRDGGSWTWMGMDQSEDAEEDSDDE